MRKREIFIVLSKKRKPLGSAESTFPYKNPHKHVPKSHVILEHVHVEFL